MLTKPGLKAISYLELNPEIVTAVLRFFCLRMKPLKTVKGSSEVDDSREQGLGRVMRARRACDGGAGGRWWPAPIRGVPR